MQDRYAGDVGDYGKIALLRFLQAQGFSIGVNWYKVHALTSERNADGSYKQDDGKYLISAKLWKCDPALASCLTKIAKKKERSIDAITKADLIPGAVYYSDPISVDHRLEWHKKALNVLGGTDLVFLDPDNGLKVKSVGKSSAKSIKYAFYEEVRDYLNAEKSVLVYNHRCRKPESAYFHDIVQRLQEETVVDMEVIQMITFPKGTIRDYFAIAAFPRHLKMIKAAFRGIADSIWGESGVCKLHDVNREDSV